METEKHAVFIRKKRKGILARGSACAPAKGSVRHRLSLAARCALSILLAVTLAVPVAALQTIIPSGGGVLKARRRRTRMQQWGRRTIQSCSIASRKAAIPGALPITC